MHARSVMPGGHIPLHIPPVVHWKKELTTSVALRETNHNLLAGVPPGARCGLDQAAVRGGGRMLIKGPCFLNPDTLLTCLECPKSSHPANVRGCGRRRRPCGKS